MGSESIAHSAFQPVGPKKYRDKTSFASYGGSLELLRNTLPIERELVYVIAWGRGQLRIIFTSVFKVFTKLPESRSDEGNLENFENTSEINP